MTASVLDFVRPLLADSQHGWSIGTFGAIGEFHRDRDERCDFADTGATIDAVTARGAIRVAPQTGLRIIAFDTPGSDPETWGSEVAFCLPYEDASGTAVVTPLGADTAALREQDRAWPLFDLGIGLGAVRFCVRTAEPTAIAALEAMAGRQAIGHDLAAIMAQFLRAQPHRVLLSPAGRIEVMAPIPMPDGRSPEGPHTHLLPALLATRRTHSANAPIPAGWQPVLNLHPRSAWRDSLGQRKPFDPQADADFDRLLHAHGLPDDRELRTRAESAVAAGMRPEDFDCPASRRARAQLRVVLRRLAATGASGPLDAWRARFDRAEADAGDVARPGSPDA